MRRELNDLQKQKCDENSYALYVHCFAFYEKASNLRGSLAMIKELTCLSLSST
jgi:hypothetical protein